MSTIFLCSLLNVLIMNRIMIDRLDLETLKNRIWEGNEMDLSGCIVLFVFLRTLLAINLRLRESCKYKDDVLLYAVARALSRASTACVRVSSRAVLLPARFAQTERRGAPLHG